jgi:glyoxylase-like metal-dependent hydrolase (beta-lactamase superfamily II)
MNEGAEAARIETIALPTPFMVGPVNCYLIKTDPPILLDAGPYMDEAFEKLERKLKDFGYGFADLGAVIVTHDHIDHAGQLARVLEAAGNAEAYGHPAAAAHLAAYDDGKDTNLRQFKTLMQEMGANGADLDIIIQDRIEDSGFARGAEIAHRLEDGGEVFGMKVHFVPGHSASDILLVNEDEGYAFSGDHVLKSVNPSPLLRVPLPGEDRGRALVELQQSFGFTRSLKLNRLYPGHGDPFDGHESIIAKLLQRHERRNKQIEELLQEDALTPFALARRLFPELDMIHMYLGISVAVAHCELLEELGRLASAHDDAGVLHYRRDEFGKSHEPTTAG